MPLLAKDPTRFAPRTCNRSTTMQRDLNYSLRQAEGSLRKRESMQLEKYRLDCGESDDFAMQLWPVNEDANEEPASVADSSERGDGATLERIPSFLYTYKTNTLRRRRRRYNRNPFHGIYNWVDDEKVTIPHQLGRDIDVISGNSSVSSDIMPSNSTSECSETSCSASSPHLRTPFPSSFLKELATRHGKNQSAERTEDSTHSHSAKRYSSDEVISMMVQLNLPDAKSVPASAESSTSSSSSSSYTTEEQSESSSWNSWWEMLTGSYAETDKTEDGSVVSKSSCSQKSVYSESLLSNASSTAAHRSRSAKISYKDQGKAVLIPKRLESSM